MRKIYKYPLEIKDEQTIQIPYLKHVFSCVDYSVSLGIKKQILKLDIQNDKPCLWIMVDTEEELRDVKVTMYGTGHECLELIDDYVGSVQFKGYSTVINHVYHVFVKEDDE